MRHRIRCASLVVRNDRLLLVRTIERRSGDDYWIPPGGGMEAEDTSIFACAERETYEETGYRVFGRSILYVQEFVDHTNQFRNMEFFILSRLVDGEVLLPASSDRQSDLPVLMEVGWFSKGEMKGMEVYPVCLKEEFWTDHQSSIIATRHLGTRASEEVGEPGATDNPDGAQRLREDH